MATPLHFAVMNREIHNVELLLSFGAEVNAQDFQGNAPLHMAMLRLAQEPDNYEEYKRILKELLFSGADRNLKNHQGQTAADLLLECDLSPNELAFLTRILAK